MELALELADVADAITTARFRALDLRVETKPDLSPVTEADRAVEKALRSRLAAARPAHALVGEEFGSSGDEDAPVRWIIDPIDGTKSYVRGIPVWATLIAVEAAGDMIAGVCSAPGLGRRWWAARGDGAFADGAPIRVSRVNALDSAHFAYDDWMSFETHSRSLAFQELERRCWRSRGFGDFWSHVLVAEGAVEIAIEPAINLWDVAPIQVIVEEAGGRFTDIAGVRSPRNGSAVSTNGLLHDEVIGLISSSDYAS